MCRSILDIARSLFLQISSVVDDKGFFDFTPLRLVCLTLVHRLHHLLFSSRCIRDTAYWKLDLRENSFRQHLQMLANTSGSAHEEAVRTPSSDPASQEEPATDTLPIPALTSPQAGHLSSEGEDEGFPSDDLLEALVPPEELLTQLLSVTCSKVVLAYSVPGTLVLTKTSIAFTADDTSTEYEKSLCLVSSFLHTASNFLWHAQ